KDDPRSAVYRHKAPRGRIRRVAKRAWTSAEYLQVDAGVNYQPSLGFMDRHNILGTEFALRCAESHPDVNMIFGEQWSSSDSLLPHTRTKVGFHRTSEQHPVRGDATIVMRDGLRVVVEMTSFHNNSIYKKLNRWAQFLTKHSMAESGVVVMFLMAPSDYTNWRDYESSVDDMGCGCGMCCAVSRRVVRILRLLVWGLPDGLTCFLLGMFWPMTFMIWLLNIRMSTGTRSLSVASAVTSMIHRWPLHRLIRDRC